MFSLKGKVAIVTGAASKRGFGRTITSYLAKNGCDIIAVDKFIIPPRAEDNVDNWRGLKSVVNEVKRIGQKAIFLTCDITKSADVNKMVQKAFRKFNKIDLLINNAGVHVFPGDIINLTDDIWKKNIDVNLNGTFFCTRAVVCEMIKRKIAGKIINIASSHGKQGVGADTAYTASKFGIIGVTQSLALELAQYEITVNSICPSQADTDLASEHFKRRAQARNISVNNMKKEIFSKRIASIPLGRLSTPEDIAGLVVYLASKEADYITGQSININGGFIVAH